MFETVYALWYYWDGPREGVADCRGQPHAFVSEWNEEADDFGEAFLLKPISDETFRMVMEDWAIHRRWEAAVSQGLATFDTHPPSPDDRSRHEELRHLLCEPLSVDTARTRQRYPFRDSPESRSSAVDPSGVLRMAAEFRSRQHPPLWKGYQLATVEVRWAPVN